MRELPHPLLLESRFLPKPWGGRRIETVLGRALPTSGDAAGPVGESWEVCDREDCASRILNGTLAGRTLADLRDGGAAYPMLLKILDATSRLSLQVHPFRSGPERDGGREADGDSGTGARRAEPKTECWFVLDAEEGAKVYRGVADGVTEKDFREALSAGRVESCLHAIDVEQGDTVFVAAGTVHTIGAGVLLFEVQQNSDTTYRLHDWDRVGLDGLPRELHVEEALGAMRYGPRPPDRIRAIEMEDEGTIRRLLLVRCPYFAVEHLTATGTFTLSLDPAVAPGEGQGPPAHPPALHMLSGEGLLRPFDRSMEPVPFVPGSTLLLPRRHDAFEIEAAASVVRALLCHPGAG